MKICRYHRGIVFYYSQAMWIISFRKQYVFKVFFLLNTVAPFACGYRPRPSDKSSHWPTFLTDPQFWRFSKDQLTDIQPLKIGLIWILIKLTTILLIYMAKTKKYMCPSLNKLLDPLLLGVNLKSTNVIVLFTLMS